MLRREGLLVGDDGAGGGEGESGGRSEAREAVPAERGDEVLDGMVASSETVVAGTLRTVAAAACTAVARRSHSAVSGMPLQVAILGTVEPCVDGAASACPRASSGPC